MCTQTFSLTKKTTNSNISHAYKNIYLLEQRENIFTQQITFIRITISGFKKTGQE